MTTITRRIVAAAVVLTISAGVGWACTDDDDAQTIADDIVAALATDTPGTPPSDPEEEDASTPEATSDISGLPEATTEGACVHGTGQSELYIIFRGLEPGETVSGSITGLPEDGLVDGESVSFVGTADEFGVFYAVKKIQRFGTYVWETDGGELTGTYVVAEVCDAPGADIAPASE